MLICLGYQQPGRMSFKIVVHFSLVLSIIFPIETILFNISINTIVISM
ncbi:MAG: hypothetical protein CENE_01522 [Candidatus Celerinatantimonas neptuna]|nr:MAG: hypothetical protein CENE_01522 [Candidatus Celerinatantimonas neptuna]